MVSATATAIISRIASTRRLGNERGSVTPYAPFSALAIVAIMLEPVYAASSAPTDIIAGAVSANTTSASTSSTTSIAPGGITGASREMVELIITASSPTSPSSGAMKSSSGKMEKNRLYAASADMPSTLSFQTSAQVFLKSSFTL